MSKAPEQPFPTEINLHRKSRLLRVNFSDGRSFEFPCEYLRVFSRAAEVTTSSTPVTGKENVNIERIEPQGNYAIRIIFDDGHDTGIYSWESLYHLGVNQQENWQGYLHKLEAMGYQRQAERTGFGAGASVKVLYFSWLAQKLHRESEELKPPASVTDVGSLIEWLRRRRADHGYLFTPDRIRITVNRQFAEPFTKLEPGDEIALVPTTPTPPAPPTTR